MPCPMCKAPTDAKYRPFCSRRCADLDLSRWLRGSYRIETEEPAEDADWTRREGGTED
ncbi:DNA gyrase inhibitor YacG [Rhodovulum sp. DZ06]|uniref:DNA gyrase inhibitor YacG n=1 Tax=Rhodovulum sp. DZ06 TaxID=3425126 RepID=UPI003D35833B